MEIGIFGVGQLHRDPVNDVMPTENDMFHELVRRAVHAEQVGLDVYAIGEHHNPPFISSADTTMLAYIAAKTDRIILSTSTTLITTNDPVRIAEEFATPAAPRERPGRPDARPGQHRRGVPVVRA